MAGTVELADRVALARDVAAWWWRLGFDTIVTSELSRLHNW